MVAGVEARGFQLASALAYATGKGHVRSARPAAPAETYREEYALEYGTAAVEIPAATSRRVPESADSDDILAPAGTLEAAVKLVERASLRMLSGGLPYWSWKAWAAAMRWPVTALLETLSPVPGVAPGYGFRIISSCRR